jgi:hypothetical protein
MLWMEEKTCWLKLTGTTGLAVTFPCSGKKFYLQRGFAYDFLSVLIGLLGHHQRSKIPAVEGVCQRGAGS